MDLPNTKRSVLTPPEMEELDIAKYLNKNKPSDESTEEVTE